MDLIFKMKHYTNKFLFTFLGPAELDDHNDPVMRLNREWRERFNLPEPVKSAATTTAQVPESRGRTPKAIA